MGHFALPHVAAQKLGIEAVYSEDYDLFVFGLSPDGSTAKRGEPEDCNQQRDTDREFTRAHCNLSFFGNGHYIEPLLNREDAKARREREACN